MVALYPTDPEPLAISGGEHPDQLHVTLVFLGQARNVDYDRLVTAVTDWANRTPRLHGVISGIGHFTEGPDPVTYWSLDAKRLAAAREQLVQTLDQHGLPNKKEHGYTPHMTIDYAIRKPPVLKGHKLVFGSAVIAHADQQTKIPFRGNVGSGVHLAAGGEFAGEVGPLPGEGWLGEIITVSLSAKTEDLPVNTANRDELKKKTPKAEGVSLKRDKKGFYVHTHRARSDSYPTVAAIPVKVIEFIESTG